MYDELIVLIPSHSLEDFPTELSEQPASSLLNAFAALMHPRLLATAGTLPRWTRADDVEDVHPRQLVIVPTACDEWIPGGWVERARDNGTTVISRMTDRDDMIAAALESLAADGEPPSPLDPDLVADFLALGTSYLLTELLTRHMRNFSHLDEIHMEREAVAGAKAALAGDRQAAEAHLRNCFEQLLECRERFYPVDCYLIDLCLVTSQYAGDELRALLQETVPVNAMISASELETIAADHPDIAAAIRTACQEGRLELVGGDWRETCSPLLSLDSVIWQMHRGHDVFQKTVNRTPTTWGRRRYGVTPQIPQILSRFGYKGGLHFVMDDGMYPDEEHSLLRWSGCDGSVIDGISRIPLAADSAASFLRFPVRMSESMDFDHTAGLVLARWPQVRTPWLGDLRRAARYAPALGKFVTLSDFFEQSDGHGRLSEFSPGDYLTPFLIQAVARQESDPISRYTRYWELKHHLDAASWTQGLVHLLTRGRIDADPIGPLEELLEADDPVPDSEALQQLDARLAALQDESSTELARLLTGTSADTSDGRLFVNTLSFPRRAVVEWPEDTPLPEPGGPILSVQDEETNPRLVVEVPGGGFLFLACPEQPSPPKPPKMPLAEDWLARNEYFEVRISDVTGGLAAIQTYRRSPNRISQQLAFRFPRERTIVEGEGEERTEYRSYYSEMRVQEMRVLSEGPALGEIETTGQIVDQVNDSVLADYRQTVRVWRGRPIVELEIDLDVHRMPEGDPWTNYIGQRFAWKHSSAVLTRSMQQGAQPIGGERIEAPHYIELADDEFRTTILPMGVPFHRTTGPRMLDTLLITAGETRRHFRTQIAVDVEFPMQAATDAMTPLLNIPTAAGALTSGQTGWLFHVSAANVQLTRILPVQQTSDAEEAHAPGFAVRLLETEGRHCTARLRCFRTPQTARQRNFQGETVNTLRIQDDTVLVEIAPYEVCDVEMTFEA
ncbi:hypothetical protein [Maioricimonas sp. JC845]|uniref:glycoside hydrolase family 38 N-terminal domain-containing protein n=1 Tax=Maioricimonas sp. JC845 TaxID=3232138 RepID=UPI0034578B74